MACRQNELEMCEKSVVPLSCNNANRVAGQADGLRSKGDPISLFEVYRSIAISAVYMVWSVAPSTLLAASVWDPQQGRDHFPSLAGGSTREIINPTSSPSCRRRVPCVSIQVCMTRRAAICMDRDGKVVSVIVRNLPRE